jgi:predicted nucleic acid-binding protein
VKVLVDTDVWSEVLRKKDQQPSEQRLLLEKLLRRSRVQIIGAIRQEVLSGLREIGRFVQFREVLRAFPDREIESGTYERAAAFYNLLRSKGIQSSNTDCLICACSADWEIPILTKDLDFVGYKLHLPIELFSEEL